MRTSRLGVPVLVALASILLASSAARAEGMPMWATNGVEFSNQYGGDVPYIASSGADGGAFLAWEQFTEDQATVFKVRAQRVNVGGIAQWTAGGVLVREGPGIRYLMGVISDGSGGAFVSWLEEPPGASTFGVYMARLNASGVPQWTVQVADGIGGGWNVQMVSDGSGGVIIAWLSTGTFAQRLNAAGTPQWVAGGIRVNSDLVSGGFRNIVSDGAGGAIITWTGYLLADYDPEHPENLEWRLYAQRLNGSGVAQWASDGVALCTGPCRPSYSASVSDGAGGAIVAWEGDPAYSHDYNVYGQRVNASGQVLWATSGVAVSISQHDQPRPVIASDGAGGAIIAWHDERNGDEPDIYAQRVGATGSPLWTTNGIAVCTAEEGQYYPQITSVQNGAIIAWQDERSGAYDVYAQHVSVAGTPLWASDGMAVCTAPDVQGYGGIVASGFAGAIVSWVDLRTQTTDYKVRAYAQRIVDDGVPPAAVNNLKAVWARYNAAVSWRDAGDDGMTGTAARVQLRTSTAPITETNWGSASIVFDGAPSGPASTLECREVKLSTCAPHYFALKTMDEGQNWSAISNVVSGSTTCSGFRTYAYCLPPLQE